MRRAPGLIATPPEDTVVAALEACHERIRRFGGLAERVAVEAATDAERAEAAAAVVRYFAVALPLHAADEDRSLAPRLVGRDAALDAALARMTADHAEHAAVLDPVVALCRQLAAAPATHAALAPTLAPAAAAMVAAFAAHLALEEAIVFPAVAALPAAVQRELRAEMLARRG